MSKFTDKNANRKSAREMALTTTGIRRSAVNEARLRRRIYKGAFGLSANHIFNDMAIGTTGAARKGKDPVL